MSNINKIAQFIKATATKSEALKWWSSLSMNEQKKYVALHPFYSKFYPMYVIEHKNGITDVYNYVLDHNLIKAASIELEKYQPGDVVIYKGGFGSSGSKKVTIEDVGEKNNHVVYDLSDGHWCYQHQIIKKVKE